MIELKFDNDVSLKFFDFAALPDDRCLLSKDRYYYSPNTKLVYLNGYTGCYYYNGNLGFVKCSELDYGNAKYFGFVKCVSIIVS